VAHAIGEQQVHPVQRMRHLPGPRRHVAPGVAVGVALDPARDDLAVAVVALGEVDQRRDQQGLALHQAEHGVSFCTALVWKTRC